MKLIVIPKNDPQRRSISQITKEESRAFDMISEVYLERNFPGILKTKYYEDQNFEYRIEGI